VRRWALLLPLIVLAGLLPASADAAGPTCPGGRLAVDGEPLLPEDLGGLADVVEIAGERIMIASGCGPVAAKLRAGPQGTRVKATWKECAGAPGKVKLKATFDPSCQTLSGVVRAPKAIPRLERAFTASLFTPRDCEHVPGVSVPAVMPPEVVNPPPPPPPDPLPPLPDPTAVSARTTKKQLAIFGRLWALVDLFYVDPAFHGLDWNDAGSRYEALLRQGLATADFHRAMAILLAELGDEHSYFLDPEQVRQQELELSGRQEFVGIGVHVLPLVESRSAVVIGVFPASPAAQAGLRPPDLHPEAAGVPLVDAEGALHALAPEGSSYDLTWQRLGGAPETVRVTRRRISAFSPMEVCRVPGTDIGYVQVNSFFDETVDDRLRAALRGLAAASTLGGLVLDLRLNPGGSSSVALPALDLFGGGNAGRFVGRTQAFDVPLFPEDVAGSQAVPLAILADRDTVSFGELFTGVLQNAGRATVLGGTTAGNVELLSGFDFKDRSQAWIATFAFEPVGLSAGAWEGVGIVPDELVPTRWDLFTEETDPALARAVEVLQQLGLSRPAPGRAALPAPPALRPPLQRLPVLRSSSNHVVNR
jgi:carboxyl-terminal processing protease